MAIINPIEKLQFLDKYCANDIEFIEFKWQMYCELIKVKRTEESPSLRSQFAEIGNRLNTSQTNVWKYYRMWFKKKHY